MICISREAVKQSQIKFYTPKSVLEQIKTQQGEKGRKSYKHKKNFALKFDNQVNPKVA